MKIERLRQQREEDMKMVKGMGDTIDIIADDLTNLKYNHNIRGGG